MNIQELIDELQKIEDKTLPVVVEDGMDPSNSVELLREDIKIYSSSHYIAEDRVLKRANYIKLG